MIMTRTPLRVSFVGGGSDYPGFFGNQEGYVLGATVNLFVYTAVIAHSSLAEHKYKVTYRINESVDSISDIQHPLIRGALQELKWNDPGLHISTLADVPARTGLGSSSAFAVGLLNALHTFKGESLTPFELAEAAINLERGVLREAGGWQDQIHSAIGGFNLIKFSGQKFQVEHKFLDASLNSALSDRMVLVSAGEPRDSTYHASQVADTLKTSSGDNIAKEMACLAKNAGSEIANSRDPEESIQSLAMAMRKGWDLKQRLGGNVSEGVSEIVSTGLRNGALAAKLCGAGGSGFILFITERPNDEGFLNLFPKSRVQKLRIHNKGSETGPLSWNI